MDETKLKRLGYKGTLNGFAINAWLIIEKHLYAQIYFSLFHKKWMIDNYIIDTKKAERVSWDNSKIDDIKFDTYKQAIDFASESIVKML